MREAAASSEAGLDWSSVVQVGHGAPAMRVRPCTENDIPKVMRFIDQHWRAGHILSRDETVLRWQFDPGRADARSFPGLTIVLAVLNGEIGGMLGLIPFDLNLNGAIRRAGWLSQWICVPALRSYNAGLALLWHIHKLKYDALLGIGVTPAGARVTAALRFESIPGIPRWVGVFDATATQQLLQTVAPFARSRELAHALGPYVVGRREPSLDEEAIQVTPWTDALREPWDRFWTRSLAPHLVGPVRDSAYLLWRYVHHPRFRYEMRVAQALGSGDILGLSVFRVETVQGHRVRAMRIVEFLARPPAHLALAAALVTAAREQDVAFADFYCTHPDAGAALEALGFRRHLDDTTLPLPGRLQPPELAASPLSGVAWLTRDLRHQLGDLAARTDLYITRADSDQDRPN